MNKKESWIDKPSLVSACWGILGSTWGKMACHPIDTVKARVQVIPGANIPSAGGSMLLNTARDVVKNDGFSGLYRGLPTAIVGGIPGAFLYFGAYEFWKKKTLDFEFFKNHSFISYLTGGMFAEAVAWLVFVPTDVLKERRQVQSKLKIYNYTSDYDALKEVLKKEGLRGIYKALPATILSFGPFSAFYFLFYEKLKGLVVANDAVTYLEKVKDSSHVKIGFFSSMFWSMLAGAGASFITNPLDLVKLRLQVQRGSKSIDPNSMNTFQYKHMLDGLIQITLKEGPLALFNGSLARVCTHFPTVAICMSVIEVSKPYMESLIN